MHLTVVEEILRFWFQIYVTTENIYGNAIPNGLKKIKFDLIR